MKKYTTLVVVFAVGLVLATPAQALNVYSFWEFWNDIKVHDQIEADSGVTADTGSFNELTADSMPEGVNADTGTFKKHIQIDGLMVKVLDNYLDPSGLVLTDADSTAKGFDLTGGSVYVSNPGSDTNAAIIHISDDPDTAFNINNTGAGGLINGSSVASDTWYECGVIADSSGDSAPAVVCWNHHANGDSTPQNADELPAGYDQLRAMGTPGKTWWIKTDGNSDILGFDHNSHGEIRWTTTARSTFGNILSVSTDDGSFSSISLGEQVPPAGKLSVSFNQIRVQDDGTGGIQVEIASDNGSATQGDGDITIPTNGDGDLKTQTGKIKNIESQQIFWVAINNSNLSSFRINRVNSFKAVN